jgi:hypothetical protein
MAVKIPSALPRSRESVKVVTSRASADGASSAPHSPCGDQGSEAWRGAARRRRGGEADQACDEDMSDVYSLLGD